MNERRSFLMFITAALAEGCVGGPSPSAPSPLLGRRLPRIRRPTLAGGTISSQDAQGRAVVVKFFAEFCEPCKRTLPAAQLLHERRSDVLIIGVSEDEHATDAEEVAHRYGLTFPIVHDRSNVLAGTFRVRELPITFVADRHGTLRYVLSAAHDEGALQDVIEWLD